MRKTIVMAIATLFLLSLSACSAPSQIVKTEYIKCDVPTLPAEPQYYSVQWGCGDQKYCLTPDNARALLKNIELMKAHTADLRTIFEGLKK